jgi:hypothetical protein
MTKLRCFKIWDVNLSTFKKQQSQKEEAQKTVKPCKPCGISKEDHGQLIKNYERLLAELPTLQSVTDIPLRNNTSTDTTVHVLYFIFFT